MRAKICHGDHGTPLQSSHCRLPRKLRITLMFTVSWNHSSLTRANSETAKAQNTAESCKQWHESEPKHYQKLFKTKHQVMGSSVLQRLAGMFSSLIHFHPAVNVAKASWDAGVKGFGSGLGQVLWKRKETIKSLLFLLEAVDVKMRNPGAPNEANGIPSARSLGFF